MVTLVIKQFISPIYLLQKTRRTASIPTCYSHFMFISIASTSPARVGSIGGRSRLHLIDLGSGDKSGGKIVNGVALSYSALGQVILALLNNQKHIPNK